MLPLLLSALSAAVAPAPETVYGDSVSYPLYVEACSAEFPAKRNEFGDALRQWKNEKRELIEAGKKQAEESGSAEDFSGYEFVIAALKSGVESFRSKPADAKLERCNSLLSELRGE